MSDYDLSFREWLVRDAAGPASAELKSLLNAEIRRRGNVPRHPDPPTPQTPPSDMARVQGTRSAEMQNQSREVAQQRAPFTDAQFREFMDVQAQQRALDSGREQQHLRKWAVEQVIKVIAPSDSLSLTGLTEAAQAIVDFVTKTAEPADDDRPF